MGPGGAVLAEQLALRCLRRLQAHLAERSPSAPAPPSLPCRCALAWAACPPTLTLWCAPRGWPTPPQTWPAGRPTLWLTCLIPAPPSSEQAQEPSSGPAGRPGMGRGRQASLQAFFLLILFRQMLPGCGTPAHYHPRRTWQPLSPVPSVQFSSGIHPPTMPRPYIHSITRCAFRFRASPFL